MRRTWRRRNVLAALAIAGGLAVSDAEASVLCRWFGHCVYESPGFRFTVIDKETEQPLADVHALAEWVLHGYHGRNGPLMVQDAVSAADGLLVFPPWGPIEAPRQALELNLDPAATLFKPGYRPLLIQNAYPKGTDETTRVRRFGQDGATFALEPFRGTPEEWLAQLEKAAFPGTKGRTSEEQIGRFQAPYLNRARRVWAEMQKLPAGTRQLELAINSFERHLKDLEELRP